MKRGSDSLSAGTQSAGGTGTGGAGRYVIEIEGSRRLVVEGGRSLLVALAEKGIFLPTVCGGRGLCGLCRVKVLEGAGPLQEAERAKLSEGEIADGMRLGCQVRVEGDLKIQLPASISGVRQYRCVCGGIEELNYDTRLFRFRLEEPASMEFTPGQYVQFFCPAYTDNCEPVWRAYSIASDPAQKDTIEIIIRRVPSGICTRYCFDYLRCGETITINGPYGQFGLSGTDVPAVFIAGSSGIAPFISMLHYMVNNRISRDVHLFFGGNTVKDVFLLERIKEFEAKLAGFRFIPVVAKPEGQVWTGQTGLVTEAVQKTFTSLAEYEGYLCGPPGMVNASVKVLTALGMQRGKIFYDKFA